MARWLLASASLLLFLSGLFMREVPRTPFDPLISAVVIVALALPAYVVLARSEGAGRALALIAGLSILSMSVEAIGVLTGVPYGPFSYGSGIGTAVIEPVPWTVGFAYVPLLLGACALARHLAPKRSLIQQAVGSGLLLVGADLVLDPGAALLGYWIWAEPGVYYGIPLSNYAGWLVTGTAYSVILLLASRGGMPVAIATSYVLILAFWTGVCLGAGMLVPTAIGFLLLAFAAPASVSTVTPSDSSIQTFIRGNTKE